MVLVLPNSLSHRQEVSCRAGGQVDLGGNCVCRFSAASTWTHCRSSPNFSFSSVKWQGGREYTVRKISTKCLQLNKCTDMVVTYILWRRLHIPFSGRNKTVVNSQGDGMANRRDCLGVLIEGRKGEFLEVTVLLL